MADFSATAGLSVGNLVINLTLDTSGLQRKLDDVNRNTKSMADKLKAEFDKAGGSIGNFGERIGQVSKSIEKMFGDKAPAALQSFGKEVQRVMALSDAQVKGLKQSADSLEGAFKLAGQAVTALLSPLGAVLLAVVSLTAAYGALKQLSNTKGWLPEFMDEPWFQSFKPGATPESPGVDFNRRAPGPNGAAAEQAYGKFFDPVTGQYRSAGSVVAIPDPVPEGPGVAETAKDWLADAVSGFVESLDNGTKGLQPALDKIKALLEPGKTDSEKKASAKAFADAEKKRLDEQKKAWAEADEAISIQLEALADQEIKDARELAEQEKAARQAAADSVKETMLAVAENERQVQDAARQAEERRVARWQALGSGQIGTAVGATGVGGAILNIVGGAASQYQLTGTAMQGAAQGGQAAGPWGAVIGAIIALATQTQTFTELMGSIEEVLGGILPILDTLLKPLAEMFKNLVDTLSPVLKIISLISNLLSQALKPIWSLVDAIGDLFGAIGSFVDSINVGGLTSALDKSVGDSDSRWGKYSVNDWLTGVGPLISELGNEISKAVNGDGTGSSYGEFSAADGPSALAQQLADKQKAERREAWDLDPRNPYYMQNINALALAKAEERQRAAKEAETREAERAAAALRELADSVTNAVSGYKLSAVMYGAQDRVGGDVPAGNPGGY